MTRITDISIISKDMAVGVVSNAGEDYAQTMVRVGDLIRVLVVATSRNEVTIKMWVNAGKYLGDWVTIYEGPSNITMEAIGDSFGELIAGRLGQGSEG